MATSLPGSAKVYSFQQEKDKREIDAIILAAQDKIDLDTTLSGLCMDIRNIVADLLKGNSVGACVTLTMFGFVDEARRLLDIYETNGEDVHYVRKYVAQDYGQI